MNIFHSAKFNEDQSTVTLTLKLNDEQRTRLHQNLEKGSQFFLYDLMKVIGTYFQNQEGYK